MEYNHFLTNLRDDDVISLSSKLYKLGKVKDSINNFIQGEDSDKAPYYLSQNFYRDGIEVGRQDSLTLLTEGIDSEILKISSSGWQKGKLKINVSIEFIPDEPEIPEYQSPLDEIRNHPSFSNTQ